jgi:hypothetical protein
VFLASINTQVAQLIIFSVFGRLSTMPDWRKITAARKSVPQDKVRQFMRQGNGKDIQRGMSRKEAAIRANRNPMAQREVITHGVT